MAIAPPTPNTLAFLQSRTSANAISNLLGMGIDWVKQRIDDGSIPRVDGKLIVGDSLGAFLRQHRVSFASSRRAMESLAELEPEGGRPDQGGPAESVQSLARKLQSNRARESELRGDKLALLNAQIRGDLLAVRDVEDAVGGVFDAIRQKLLALPSRVAPMVYASDSIVQVREKLAEVINEVCEELSEADVEVAILERTRRRASRRADDEAVAEAAQATAADDA